MTGHHSPSTERGFPRRWTFKSWTASSSCRASYNAKHSLGQTTTMIDLIPRECRPLCSPGPVLWVSLTASTSSASHLVSPVHPSADDKKKKSQWRGTSFILQYPVLGNEQHEHGLGSWEESTCRQCRAWRDYKPSSEPIEEMVEHRLRRQKRGIAGCMKDSWWDQ